MDDISYRKLRNIVTIAPKPQITWTELSKGRIVALPDFCGGIGGGVGGHQKVETNMEKIKNLVTNFLYVSVLLSFFINCEDRLRLAIKFF